MLTDTVALVLALVISLLAATKTHVPPGILLIQVLAIELLFQAPLLLVLNHEKQAHKPRHLTQYQAFMEIFLFGALAAVIAYLNYRLFFARHGLGPAFIDTAHPFYIQATTLAYATLALCQCMNLIFVRADNHKTVFSEYLWNNPKLVRMAGLAGFILLNIIYNPLLQPLFGTKPLDVIDWLMVMGALALYSGLRMVQRHTRQHTRHAIIHLHHEVHKSR